jgi:hypothetical protein
MTPPRHLAKGSEAQRHAVEVDRWQTGVPTDERSKTPLKIGICIDVFYPVDRWNECEGVLRKKGSVIRLQESGKPAVWFLIFDS